MDARLNAELPGGQPVDQNLATQTQRLRPSDDQIERVMDWSADRASDEADPPTEDPRYARGWNDAVAWCIGQSDYEPSGS